MEPLLKIEKRHRLDITLEDIARVAGVTMHVVYSDLKRGKFKKDDLGSILNYVDSKTQSVGYYAVPF
jgi:predicted transcriptional regulator